MSDDKQGIPLPDDVLNRMQEHAPHSVAAYRALIKQASAPSHSPPPGISPGAEFTPATERLIERYILKEQGPKPRPRCEHKTHDYRGERKR